MPRTPRRTRPVSLPPVPTALLRTLLPRAERDEILTDLTTEFESQAATHGLPAARRWIWSQALRSAPALLGWSGRREVTGFEPDANVYRPGGPMLKTLFADARYAARRIRTRPGYTVLAVLTLALGVGGTAAVFGIARPLILAPLPYDNAERVGTLWMGGSWTEQEFMFLRGKVPGFQTVAAYRQGDVTMRDGTAPMRLVPGISTSFELFDVLGARPFLGRTLRAGDDVPGNEPVAVLSHGLWQELGGNTSIIGRRVTIDGSARTIVGVMPRGFWFPDPGVRIWLPQGINPERSNGSYTLVGHAAPGVDVSSMAPQLKQLVTVLGQRFTYSPDWDKTRNPVVTPLRDDLLGSMKPALVATFVAMALILLIACVNVAAIMLGQVEGRAAEMAVRTALGATRGRLTQQLVVESLLLGAGAALVGGALAVAGFRVLARALPIGTWSESVAFDWRLFGIALTIAMIAALLVVLVPTISLWRGDLRGALNRARTGGIEGRGSRLERGLVVTEVALAMLIASGAALLARSVNNLYAIDPGLDTRNVGIVDVIASADLTAQRRWQSIQEMLTAVSAIPGVASVDAVMKPPLRGKGDSFGVTVPGKPQITGEWTYFRIVSSGYHATMGMSVREGRSFRPSDVGTPNEIPIVINEEAAKQYFPGESAVGRLLRGGFDVPQRIIGVVGNAAEADLTDAPEPVRYFRGGIVSWFGPHASIVIRTNGTTSPVAVLEAARKAVQQVAPNFAVQGTTTMARVMDLAVGPARQIMALLGLLSGLALLLGAIGIYGVISHFAARRKRDWAIRVALGLSSARVMWQIVGQGVALAAAGIVIGAIGTAALSRLLTSFLFGVSTVDPLAFAAASAALLIVGIAAAFVPARRAGSVDPARVLREQ